MNRGIPVMNKICFQKNLERDRKIHFDKIQTMKSSIDKNPPQAFEFLTNRKKKEQQMESRMTEIERENKILLSKITGIMQKGTIRRSQTTTSMMQKTFLKKSLNGESRKRDLVKIVIENQAILKRIQDKKSAYDIKKWEKDREQVEKYIANACQYQYKDFKNKTFIQLGHFNDSPNQTTKKQYTNKLEPLQQATPPLKKGKQNLIFSKARKVGQEYFFIKIFTQGGLFCINLQCLENNNQVYDLNIPEPDGIRILRKDCKNDPEILIQKLIVDEKARKLNIKKDIMEPAMRINNNNQNFNEMNENEEIENSQQQHHQKPQNNQLKEIEQVNEDPKNENNISKEVEEQKDQEQNQDNNVQQQNEEVINNDNEQKTQQQENNNDNNQDAQQPKQEEPIQQNNENEINEQIGDNVQQ